LRPVRVGQGLDCRGGAAFSLPCRKVCVCGGGGFLRRFSPKGNAPMAARPTSRFKWRCSMVSASRSQHCATMLATSSCARAGMRTRTCVPPLRSSMPCLRCAQADARNASAPSPFPRDALATRCCHASNSHISPPSPATHTSYPQPGAGRPSCFIDPWWTRARVIKRSPAAAARRLPWTKCGRPRRRQSP
jgi:hypothetical protein